MEYISDIERGRRPRDIETVTDAAWGGIVAYIEAGLENGDYALYFPVGCEDVGKGTIATDRRAFFGALRAEIPDLESLRPDSAPDFLVALDAVQFCYSHVARAFNDAYHSYYSHHHLDFDEGMGRKEFRARINRIFERNGIAFELTKDGQVRRTVPEEFEKALVEGFDTGDDELDELLTRATKMILEADPLRRTDALEKLWDGWERLKTIHGSNKKKSASKLLDEASQGSSAFRDMLQVEANTLTRLGNEFRIRHHEQGKTKLETSEQVDYLFYRLLVLIRHLLRFS